MAITRCPYCHAIIDEADKYCNNCGTQLLFAEDDEIEEEIPGEKIVDAEVEDKDYTVDEPEEKKRRKPAKDLESEINAELGDDEEPVEPALEELVDEEGDEEDDVTEEVILVDEIAAAEKRAAASDAEEPEKGEGEDEEVEDVEVVEDEDLEDEEEEIPKEEETREHAIGGPQTAAPVEEPGPPATAEGEPEVEYVVEPAPPDEASTAGEAAFRPATFDTKELEELGRTVELSKAKVDQFLEVMKEQRTPPAPAMPAPEPPPPPTPEETQAPTPEAQADAHAGPAPDETPAPSTGSLPPWASSLKGAPVFSEDSGPIETRKLRGGGPAPETDEEVEIFPKRRSADSTIGLPERISQSPLPFEEAEPKAEDHEELAEEAEADEAGAGEAEGTVAASYRDLTPERAVLPAGEVRLARGSVLPGRAAAGGREAEAAAPEEDEEPGPRPPFSLSVFFKSKAFDVLFVGLFWLVALWLAAASLGATLFSILASMSGPMLLLYVVFLGIYIFLFKFFLGETLGDRLFRPRE